MELDRSTEACVGFETWTGSREVIAPSSNVESGSLPFQSWRNFKEAFAPEIVARAIAETRGQVRHVLDPFGGSGTTALACQFLGVRPTTIEVNPYLADLIEAKLTLYDPDVIACSLAKVMDGVWRRRRQRRICFKGGPATLVEPGSGGRYVFSRLVAERISAFLQSIDELESESVRRLFRVLLASTLLPASNVTVSGKGRRYRQRWQDRPVETETINYLFEDLALRALHDITRFRDRACLAYNVYRRDAREVVPEVGKIDLVVCSPPYPNSFDYTDVYNVELWVLGYLQSREDNTKLRNATVRSHVQIKRDMQTSFEIPKSLSGIINKLRAVRGNLWNRHIPDMVGAYFQDMHDILGGMHANLRRKGRIYLVVGDSQYAGVSVPVSRILAEIADMQGYSLVYEELFRSMRASPQQGGRELLPETLLVLEKRH